MGSGWMRGHLKARVPDLWRAGGRWAWTPRGPGTPAGWWARPVGAHGSPHRSPRPVLSTGPARTGFLLTATRRDQKAQLSPPCPQVMTRDQEVSGLSERQRRCTQGPAARRWPFRYRGQVTRRRWAVDGQDPEQTPAVTGGVAEATCRAPVRSGQRETHPEPRPGEGGRQARGSWAEASVVDAGPPRCGLRAPPSEPPGAAFPAGTHLLSG